MQQEHAASLTTGDKIPFAYSAIGGALHRRHLLGGLRWARSETELRGWMLEELTRVLGSQAVMISHVIVEVKGTPLDALVAYGLKQMLDRTSE